MPSCISLAQHQLVGWSAGSEPMAQESAGERASGGTGGGGGPGAQCGHLCWLRGSLWEQGCPRSSPVSQLESIPAEISASQRWTRSWNGAMESQRQLPSPPRLHVLSQWGSYTVLLFPPLGTKILTKTRASLSDPLLLTLMHFSSQCSFSSPPCSRSQRQGGSAWTSPRPACLHHTPPGELVSIPL